eukprot:2410958-Amphidinium_carterae.1
MDENRNLAVSHARCEVVLQPLRCMLGIRHEQLVTVSIVIIVKSFAVWAKLATACGVYCGSLMSFQSKHCISQSS